MHQGFWLYFWIVGLIVAAVSFGGITLLVAVRGGREMIRMFRNGHAPSTAPREMRK